MSSNAAMNDGSDFDEEFLTKIYDTIMTKSIRTRHVKPPTKSMRMESGVGGILEKRSGRRWKPGFYMLNDHCLYHFDSDQSDTPSSFIPLERLFLIGKDATTFILKGREEETNVVIAKLSDNGTVKFKTQPEILFRSH